jgi:heterodisulfide reductase subunit B
MDVSPTRIMHLLQMQCALGEDSPAGEEYAKRAMEAQTPWLCAGCMACTTRCPQGVDIAGTMDVLRQEGLRRGTTSSARRVKDIQALHRTFLAKALKRGRIHEVGLVMGYKMRTGHLLADAHLAPKMWWKGKLHLLGGRKVDTARVKEAIQTLKQARGSSTGGRAARGTGIGEKGGS